MKNKKLIFILIFLSLIVAILPNVNNVKAVEVSYCCEKTTTGAWCLNAPQSQCDSNYRSTPTSCEATSYCRLGTCINVDEGICMENTPERTCQEAGGIWKAEEPEEIPQCQLGCCLIGDQASFTTQTRCKSLSGKYGLEVDFRSDIRNEIQCIASAGGQEKGACVFGKELEKTCKILTKEECLNMKASPQTVSSSILDLFNSQEGEVVSVSFHEGRLCTDEALGTNCARTDDTTCTEGKDEVYFIDSCGNPTNIYDASKINDQNYWSEIKTKLESCTLNDGLGNARSCGNCEYFAGSTCKGYDRFQDGSAPNYGNFICRDLSCEYQNSVGATIRKQHGETWCESSAGTSFIEVERNEVVEKQIDQSVENVPGSRYFRMVCYNGDVTVEACSDFRQEVCVESSVNGFSTADCRVNKWEGCLGIDNRDDCENTENLDCQWTNTGNLKSEFDSDMSDAGFNNYEDAIDYFNDRVADGNADSIISGSGISAPINNPLLGGLIEKSNPEVYFKFVCAPKYSPGFDFYSESTDAGELCSIASAQGTITYQADWALDGPDKDLSDCIDNCHLITPQWQSTKQSFCSSLGDCGVKENYLEKPGDNVWGDLFDRF